MNLNTIHSILKQCIPVYECHAKSGKYLYIATGHDLYVLAQSLKYTMDSVSREKTVVVSAAHQALCHLEQHEDVQAIDVLVDALTALDGKVGP